MDIPYLIIIDLILSIISIITLTKLILKLPKFDLSLIFHNSNIFFIFSIFSLLGFIFQIAIILNLFYENFGRKQFSYFNTGPSDDSFLTIFSFIRYIFCELFVLILLKRGLNETYDCKQFNCFGYLELILLLFTYFLILILFGLDQLLYKVSVNNIRSILLMSFYYCIVFLTGFSWTKRKSLASKLYVKISVLFCICHLFTFVRIPMPDTYYSILPNDSFDSTKPVILNCIETVFFIIYPILYGSFQSQSDLESQLDPTLHI